MDRRAGGIDRAHPVMDEAMQTLMLLADLQTMGCTLISNFAATARCVDGRSGGGLLPLYCRCCCRGRWLRTACC